MSSQNIPESPGGSLDMENSFVENETSISAEPNSHFSSEYAANFGKYQSSETDENSKSVWKPISELRQRGGRIPRLTDLIIRKFAQDYAIYPAIDQLPREHVDSVVQLLDPSRIDFPSAARYIQHEGFWKKLCYWRWGSKPVKPVPEAPAPAPAASMQSSLDFLQSVDASVDTKPTTAAAMGVRPAPVRSIDVSTCGNSYKRYYCQHRVTELIQQHCPDHNAPAPAHLLDALVVAAPYVCSLSLRCVAPWPTQQLPHDSFLGLLPRLHALSLGPSTRVGLDFDSSLLLIPAATLACVCSHITRSRLLASLSLTDLQLSDSHALMLARAIASSTSLTSLNLAHNAIGDAGIPPLVASLSSSGVLLRLSLADNAFTAVAAESIAAWLQQEMSCAVAELDLSLTALGDRGGELILNALAHNDTVRKLDLTACVLGERSCRALMQLLQADHDAGRTMPREITVSGNTDLLGCASFPQLMVLLRSLRMMDYVRWRPGQVSALDVPQTESLVENEDGNTASVDNELVDGEKEAVEAQRRRKMEQRAVNRKKFQMGWSDMI